MKENDFQINEVLYYPQDKIYGLSYTDWIIKWWKFMFSVKIEDSLAIDTTGVNCQKRQKGPVWFLAGTLHTSKIKRTCRIPLGKSLFFPVINTEWNRHEYQSGDVLSLATKARKNIDKVSRISLLVDGKSLNLSNFRFGPIKFEVNIINKNFLNLPAGRVELVSDGYWAGLKPLSVGKHDILFEAEDPDMELQVIYEIDIQPPINLRVIG